MNKTVNINLGGMFFHIDEDAYIKLSRYFEAIKKQLSESDGKSEIMSDIEIRISELFSEKLKNDKQVISMNDLDEVITIMGEPQDYRLDDEEPTKSQPVNNSSSRSKKLYRDIDKNVLGGVCRGLGYYIGLDVVWVRIIMILLAFITQGVGVLIYIILWIVVPKAATTSEKLEMKGETVNISNIEKKVREEFENLSDKVSNIDYEKYKNKAQSGAKNFGNSVGDFFSGLFKVISKIFGVLLILFSVTTLAALLIALFTLGSTEFFQLPWMGISEAFNYSEVPIWILVVLFFLAIGIPFIMLLILGFKILIPNTNPTNKIFKYSMFGVWIMAIIALIVIGVRQASEVAFKEKVSETQYINIQPNDTLKINIASNKKYESYRSSDFRLVLDQNDNETIYSAQVKYNIYKTKEAQPYIIVNRIAEGNSLINAKKRAEQIKYNFKTEGNQITFDDYLLTEIKSKYRNQSVNIEIYIPEKQVFLLDESLNKYWYKIYIDGNNYNGTYHDRKTNHIYIFKDNNYICLDCETTETIDIKQNNTKINDSISNGPEVSSKERLKIGSDGTIIKNQ